MTSADTRRKARRLKRKSPKTKRKPIRQPAFLEGYDTIEETAARAGRSVASVWRYVRRGRLCCNGERIFLEALDHGGALFFASDALVRFAEACARANRRTATSPDPTTQQED